MTYRANVYNVYKKSFPGLANFFYDRSGYYSKILNGYERTEDVSSRESHIICYASLFSIHSIIKRGWTWFWENITLNVCFTGPRYAWEVFYETEYGESTKLFTGAKNVFPNTHFYSIQLSSTTITALIQDLSIYLSTIHLQNISCLFHKKTL